MLLGRFRCRSVLLIEREPDTFRPEARLEQDAGDDALPLVGCGMMIAGDQLRPYLQEGRVYTLVAEDQNVHRQEPKP